jgi:integrase
MKKLKLPFKPYTGLTIYCNKCKIYLPYCKHYEHQHYRLRLHIIGTYQGKKVKKLSSKNYDDAVQEAINLKRELRQNNYETIQPTVSGNDYSLTDAIIKYNQYLSGSHELAHLRKNVSDEYRKECIRFCKYFCNTVKKTRDVARMRVVEVNQSHVAEFYSWAEKIYSGKTFNKCMGALKSFFEFLINTEEIEMKNPFQTYVSKHVTKKENLSLTKNEFDAIMEAVVTTDHYIKVGKHKEKKNMFYTYLQNGFKLFLLTGGRREEVVSLKWSDIYCTDDGVLFFKVSNLKVERSKKREGVLKYFPINSDLLDFLNELGFEKHKGTDRYVLHPYRTAGSDVIMNNLSKAFSHYRKNAGITKDISLKNLRKTYITWMQNVLGKQTGLVTSHHSNDVIDKYYIDPTILPAIEKAALNMRVFG